MSYYMNQVYSAFVIKKLANDWEHLAWTNNNIILNSSSIEDALDACGWTVEIDNNGNIDDIYFTREKLGDEDIIFDCIAPAVESGSFIEMCGEEGDRWRWVFINGRCKVVNANIIWDA